MSTSGRSDSDITPREVLEVAFDAEKHGYNRDQVDSFLERLAAAIEDLQEQLNQARAARPSAPAAEPVRVSSEAAPRLHDPDGAVTRMLAIAQETADRLVHEADQHRVRTVGEADTYAQRTRGEADDYAASTKGEADRYAERVTADADAQAQAIRAAAADEARAVAEEARQQVIAELSALEGTREQLLSDREILQAHLDEQRSRLHEQVAAVAELLDRQDFLRLEHAPSTSGVEVATLAVPVAAADLPGDAHLPPDADLSSDADVPAADSPGDTALPAGTALSGDADVSADTDLRDEDDPADTLAERDEYRVGPDPDTQLAPVVRPFDEPAEDAGPGQASLLDDQGADDRPAEPPTMSVPIAHFDDDADDDGPAWFSELTGEGPAVADEGSGEIYLDDLFQTGEGPVLDLAGSADRPATDRDASADDGGRFLAELREADDDGLEPADDDTDAAMTAFFDQDAPAGDEPSGRWRMFRR